MGVTAYQRELKRELEYQKINLKKIQTEVDIKNVQKIQKKSIRYERDIEKISYIQEMGVAEVKMREKVK